MGFTSVYAHELVPPYCTYVARQDDWEQARWSWLRREFARGRVHEMECLACMGAWLHDPVLGAIVSRAQKYSELVERDKR